MWILPLLGYVGVILGFAFLTLAIASGLYYLSELVEEHTVFAKKLLYRLIYGVVGIQVLLLVVDRFPIGLSALSVVSHFIYAQNLRRFPIVKLTDPLFLASCALVIANHYLWFRHFSAPPASSYSSYPYSRDANIPTFTEIASYFGLCVWLVPFALFVSLSAGENVLPSMGSEYATGDGSTYITPGKAPESYGIGSGVGVGGASSSMEGKRRARSGTNAGMAKAVVTGVREWATVLNPPEFVNLPPHFHPILVDRIVNFIYTSDYLVVQDGTKQLIQKNFKFYHATVVPDINPPTAATTALVDIHDCTFHLHMYALAEELEYDALKSAAHTKLVQLFVNVRNETPSAIKDAINATFAPLGSPSRICKDGDGMLQQLIIAGVLAHEFKTWTEADQKAFSDDTQGPEYADFRSAYNRVKGANQDLIEIGDTARSLAAERKVGMERRRAAKKAGIGKVDQSKLMVGSGSPLGVSSARPTNMKDNFKRRVEKRGVGAVAKVDGDEDMDMEVD
ncbi:transmembrane adaptor Erv26-domain-containing protein [Alternaria rosae]|uniref:transmembrane adaptor Erv26-domain-containing protein n=1 Tax=Alternaria rosae TaxID=1187941 RepID=UPI001E8D674B|nr:transmembrane adaptor Erv26-domain-containing protein [Alternaria rosae]KAH6866699.1 transmembrane adaptor Erv26-domain-containing protein [Alternaria rosae]